MNDVEQGRVTIKAVKLSKLQKYILARMRELSELYPGQKMNPMFMLEYFGSDLLSVDYSLGRMPLLRGNTSHPQYAAAFAAVSRAISRLVARGCIERIRKPSIDTRNIIGLTELGKQLSTAAFSAESNRLPGDKQLSTEENSSASNRLPEAVTECKQLSTVTNESVVNRYCRYHEEWRIKAERYRKENELRYKQERAQALLQILGKSAA